MKIESQEFDFHGSGQGGWAEWSCILPTLYSFSLNSCRGYQELRAKS
jgi:hypothetical protein